MMNPSSPPPSSSTTYQQQQHQQPPRPSASPYHHPQHHHHQLPPPPPQQQHSPVNGYHHLPPHQQMQQHHPMEASGYHHHVDYHEAWRREQHQHRVLEEREREREREHHEAQRHAGHPVHYRQDGYDAAAYQHQPPHHAHAAHHPQLPSPPGRGHSRTQSRDTFLPPPLPPVRDDRQSPAMRFEPLKQRRSPSSGDWRDGREAQQQQQHKRKRSGAYDQYGPGAWDHHQTYPPGYDYRAHAAAAAAEEEYYYHQHQRQQQEAAAAAAQHQQHQQQQHRQAQREREREGDRHHERERDSARPSAPPVQKAHRRTASVEQRKGGNKLPPPVSPSVMGAHAPPPPHHMASPYDAPQMLPHGRPATHEEMAMYEHSQMYGQHPPPPPPHQQATANGSRHHDARRRHEHPQAHHELHHAPAINGNGGYDDRHHRAPPSASAAAAAAAAMPPPPPPASHSHPEMAAAHAHGHGHGHDPHGMVAEPPAAMLPPPGAAAAGAHPAHMRHPHQHPQHPPQQHPMAPPIHQLQRHRVISDGVWHWLEENEAASSSSSSKDASAPRIAGSFIYEPWATPLLPADLIVRNVGSLLEVRVPGQLLGAYREKSDARAREGWTLGWRARQHGCRVDLGEGAKVVSDSRGAGEGGGATSFWANRGLAERKVWGSEVYTDDSDVLGMCVHAGWIEGPTRLPSNEGERPPQPNGAAHSDAAGAAPLYSPPDIRVLLRIAPRLVGYRESYAGGLWSRNWLGMHDGLSLVVEEVSLEPAGWAQKSKLPGARGVKSEAGRLGVLQKKVERLGEMEEDEEVMGVVVDEMGKPSAAGEGGGDSDRTASLFSLLTRSDSSLRKTVFPLSEVRTMATQAKGKGGEDSTAMGAAKKQHGKEWYRLHQVVAMRG